MPRTFVIVDRRQIPTRKPFYESIEEATAALLNARRERPADPETLVLVAIEDGQPAVDLTVDVVEGAPDAPGPVTLLVKSGQRAP